MGMALTYFSSLWCGEAHVNLTQVKLKGELQGGQWEVLPLFALYEGSQPELWLSDWSLGGEDRVVPIADTAACSWLCCAVQQPAHWLSPFTDPLVGRVRGIGTDLLDQRSLFTPVIRKWVSCNTYLYWAPKRGNSEVTLFFLLEHSLFWTLFMFRTALNKAEKHPSVICPVLVQLVSSVPQMSQHQGPYFSSLALWSLCWSPGLITGSLHENLV